MSGPIWTNPHQPHPHAHYPRGYTPAGSPAEVAKWQEEHGRWLVSLEAAQPPLTEGQVRAIVRDELRRHEREQLGAARRDGR